MQEKWLMQVLRKNKHPYLKWTG